MTEPRPLRILVGADVPPDPNAGASGTVFQMNAALRRLGHAVDEIWAGDLGRRIAHGNLHYLLELPRAYAREVRRRSADCEYDVVELNQPHAYRAAREHRKQERPGVFVTRTHGHEVRAEEAQALFRERLNGDSRNVARRAASAVLQPLLDRHWSQVAQWSDGFVVSSNDDAAFLQERFEVLTARVGVITQGVPQAFLDMPPTPWTGERAKRLLYVGQLAFIKGPTILGEVVSLVLQEMPDATMTWVCAPQHHAAARALVDPAVLNRVACRDWMPQEELAGVLDTHGVFLFPSLFEGFGKAPLEAMARGLCVVASATGGMKDYIRDNENGLLVPVGDTWRMTQAVLGLLRDEAQQRRLSEAARATALEHTWDRCARDAEAFYRRLLLIKKASGGR